MAAALVVLLIVAACGESQVETTSESQAAATEESQVAITQYYPTSTCSPHSDPIGRLPNTNVAWHPDGATIYFSTGTPSAAIYAVAADGSRLELVARTSPAQEVFVGRPARMTISPSGMHVVYGTCAYRSQPPPGRGQPAWLEYDPELARASTDGTGESRLTTDSTISDFPAWSPDGSQIAFLSSRLASRTTESSRTHGGLRLFTMAADGTDIRPLDIAANGTAIIVAPHPPRWSPDGQRLAVVGYDERPGYSIYTISAGGGDMRRITETVSGPSWSPDGKRIAFAMADPERDTVGLYTIAADGTDARRVTTIRGWQQRSSTPLNPDPTAVNAWIETVAWSPSGSQILFSCFGIGVVDLDGTLVNASPLPGELASWSPDGSRIATVSIGPPNRAGYSDTTVYTAAPDGSVVQAVARAEPALEPVPVQAGRVSTPLDAVACEG